MKEIIAIPDIHGRTFWKIVENDKSDSTIVFLGDYLDPYPHEKITFEDALVNFEEIIDSDWYKNCVENREGNVATQLNNLFQTNPELFKIVSRSRGGWYPFGSPIWSDYDDIYFSDLLQNGKIRQIFGHTMGSIMRNYKNMYCLDCQKVFRVTDQEVKEY